MESNITIRFFSVTKEKASHPCTADLLKIIDGKMPLSTREVQLGTGLRVRLERLEEEKAGYLSGELIRIQSSNLPSEVHANGTKPLSSDAPLGHGVAFRYDPKNSKLAIQYDTRVLGPGRFIEYLMQAGSKSSLRLSAVQKGEDAWERFSAGAPRKFEIAISGPEALSDLDADGEAVAASIKRMSEAYEAPRIKVEVSMGRRRKGSLNQNIHGAVRMLYNAMKSGALNIDSMKAKVEDEKDVINFIDDMLSHKEKLELPDNNPEISYALRSSLIKKAMSDNGL